MLVAAADRLAAAPLESLDDAGLRAVLQERKAAHDHGVDVYIADFIPFAHGARLFGSAYNDVLRPEDPYEFTDPLTATPMLSLRRNAALERLAACLRDGDEAAAERALAEYLAEFGDAGGFGGQGGASPGAHMVSAGAGTASGAASGTASGAASGAASGCLLYTSDAADE